MIAQCEFGPVKRVAVSCEYYPISLVALLHEVVSEIRKSKAPLIDIKWCTDGTFLLVASEDGRVYVHDAYDGNLRTISANAGAPIVSLDLSADGKFFQAATAVNELHFYAVADGTMVSSPALLRDTIWASITVPLGWNV